MAEHDDDCRVLVVDDDPPLRKLIVAALRRGRHAHVEGVANGVEAIEQLREGAPWNVLVLDLMMPKLSGWDVLEWLAQHRSRVPQSVIVASAADRKILRELHPELVNAILFKPFDVFQLAAYVRSACRLREADRRRRRIIAEVPGSGER
ncbi:MAG TPA: response regulator [Thermoanaerobaculia bacterium]|jgi:CheY-like chemotaxis protein|nr:response regulator [Thermoanaerobaculia bacterium]